MGRGRPARFRPLALGLTLCLAAGACSSAGPSTIRAAHVGASFSGVGTLPRPASAWPEAGYDARDSSATRALGPRDGHVRWVRRLTGNATPGAVIGTDGSIVQATNDGVLHDLDPRTGRDEWTFDAQASYGSDLSTSPAVLAGGTILWPGPRDTLYALSGSGRLRWTESFGGQVLSPAIAGRNRVYVADLAGHLTALTVTGEDHRRIWTIDVGGPDYASATVGQNGTIYTASKDDLVAVRDLGASAAILWRLHTARLVEVSNAVGPDGTVVLGTNNDMEFGVTPAGKLAWAFDVHDYTYSSSIVRPNGIGYFGDNLGRLHLVDSRTGKIALTIAPLGAGNESIWTSVAVDAVGDFYWATTKGNIYGYDASGRQLLHVSAQDSIDSYPALGADGTLYVATTGGELYAIGR